jgi:RNA polymerase subunit RPABC4/transcription elongation factor Spt4
MTEVRCYKCKHVVKATTRVPKLCPYCGNEGTLEELDANSSFTDINDMLK